MATQRNENAIGGRYLIQNQDHMVESQPVAQQAERPLGAGNENSPWVPAGKVAPKRAAQLGDHAELMR